MGSGDKDRRLFLQVQNRLEDMMRQEWKKGRAVVPDKKPQTLRSLIAKELPADTYLVHPQDVGFIPVGILEAADLASGVLDEWDDILDAKITVIRSGQYGQEMELEGISSSRLMAFDGFLAGTIQYRPVPSPEMKM